jgi:hypothetical protein
VFPQPGGFGGGGGGGFRASRGTPSEAIALQHVPRALNTVDGIVAALRPAVPLPDVVLCGGDGTAVVRFASQDQAAHVLPVIPTLFRVDPTPDDPAPPAVSARYADADECHAVRGMQQNVQVDAATLVRRAEAAAAKALASREHTNQLNALRRTKVAALQEGRTALMARLSSWAADGSSGSDADKLLLLKEVKASLADEQRLQEQINAAATHSANGGATTDGSSMDMDRAFAVSGVPAGYDAPMLRAVFGCLVGNTSNVAHVAITDGTSPAEATEDTATALRNAIVTMAARDDLQRVLTLLESTEHTFMGMKVSP